MRIGGLQKYSLIDYPPLISCVIFTSGCNFRCPYCHNPDLIAPDPGAPAYSPDEIRQFLHTRGKYLDAVVISGGEPTLQAGLADFCREVRSMGLAVKIDTNGSHPRVIRDLIGEGLIDYIAMDIKTAPERYREQISEQADPGAIRDSVRVILDSGIAHEFRTTCVKPLIDMPAARSMAALIAGADLHAIQKPQTARVWSPQFFQDSDRFYTDAELADFQSVFAGAVRQAVIR